MLDCGVRATGARLGKRGVVQHRKAQTRSSARRQFLQQSVEEDRGALELAEADLAHRKVEPGRTMVREGPKRLSEAVPGDGVIVRRLRLLPARDQRLGLPRDLRGHR